MTATSSFLETIADNLDQRRLELTSLRRILLNFLNTPLEGTAVRMGIPMIYAVWEGYVKEVCQLYLEYIENTVLRVADLNPAILGYLWTSALRPLTGGLNVSRKTSVAKLALKTSSAPVVFERTEKEIDTKSNLNYGCLEKIAEHLCLDISPLAGWKKHLDALVNLRNNIAHGSRPNGLRYSNFDGHVYNVVNLMEAFEQVLSMAVTSRVFCAI